jgi:hydrogenase expression/formation protein HypE
MMADLIKHLFSPQFESPYLAQMGDAAAIELPINGQSSLRLAFSTDSFVVNPLRFPGGDIGDLAVNGTVNDVAMTGARPLLLSAGFILEEGLPMESLGLISASMARACRQAGVQLAAGDTKVVEKGHGDGLYINTAGIGLIPPGVDIGPANARPGDAIILSGTIGDHGIAIMSMREGLGFESSIQSDTAPLNGLVEAMLAASPEIHCLRDATRGGLAAVLNELAESSQVGIEFDEQTVPVRAEVAAACEMLGLDPLYVANEGKLVAILPEQHAREVLAAMHTHPYGQQATIIGQVVGDHAGMVLSHTSIGGRRVVDMPGGELLPRIC